MTNNITILNKVSMNPMKPLFKLAHPKLVIKINTFFNSKLLLNYNILLTSNALKNSKYHHSSL